MGLRYRKSIGLGGGFRINLSKSGVGYSWGVKGYRITKTARGTIRRTASIPGTGISYVEENSGGAHPAGRPAPSPIVTSPDENTYDTQKIVNGDASRMVSSGLEELLGTAKKTLTANRISNYGIWITAILGSAYPRLFLLCFFFIGLKIYCRTAGLVDLDYSIDADQNELVENRIKPMKKATESEKIWRIVQSSKVIDVKYAAGANKTVKRVNCVATAKAIFPFRSNALATSFKSGKEVVIFLPDKLFLIQGSKIGALNYSDIVVNTHDTRFIEDERVPKDAVIVGRTWRFVNKNGGPDKRFKNNRELPVCRYGEIELHAAAGLNTVIMFSNASLV
jgi:hypothetical protein